MSSDLTGCTAATSSKGLKCCKTTFQSVLFVKPKANLPCFIKHILNVCLIFSSTSFTQAKSKGKAGQWAGQTRINCRSSIQKGRNVRHHHGWDSKASQLRQRVIEFCHPAESPRAPFLQGSLHPSSSGLAFSGCISQLNTCQLHSCLHLPWELSLHHTLPQLPVTSWITARRVPATQRSPRHYTQHMHCSLCPK